MNLQQAIDAGYEPDPPVDAKCYCRHRLDAHQVTGCTACACGCFFEDPE